jgi:hypothetical protein
MAADEAPGNNVVRDNLKSTDPQPETPSTPETTNEKVSDATPTKEAEDETESGA